MRPRKKGRCYYGCAACRLNVSIGDRTACGGKVARISHYTNEVGVDWPGGGRTVAGSKLSRSWTGLLLVAWKSL